MKKTVGIYKITSPTGKVYIGQSVDCERRKNSYTKMHCKGQRRLYNSIKKYNWSEHVFEVIEECDVELLNERERFWQEYYNTIDDHKGLNCMYTKTSDKSGYISEETRILLCNRKIREFSDLEWSDERRLKASETMRKAMLGSKLSDATKLKLSESHKGLKSLDKNHKAVKVKDTLTNKVYGSMKSAWLDLYKDQYSYFYFKNMLRNINRNKTSIEILAVG